MINRLVMVGLLAGLCAGLLVATLQHFSATRLILIAETYETAQKAELPAAFSLHKTAGLPVILAHNHGAPSHSETAADEHSWKPENGFQRTAFTTVVTIATAMSFALLLLAAMLAGREVITPMRAMAYGGAAFLAFGLAPAAGLAPELPGSAAADVGLRQAWWLGTALATALAIWLAVKSRSPWLMALAAILLIAPHIIGAPHPAAMESKVPAELAARFAALSLALQAVLWIASGCAAGYFWQRSERAALA